MKVFSIVGWSGCGKTALMIRLIQQLKQKNLRVMAVKRVHQYDLQPETKDTYRFLEAGADEVCMAAAKEIMLMKHINQKEDIFPFLETHGQQYDIMLLEGLHCENIPKIEVYDSHRSEPLKFPVADLCAVVSDRPVTPGLPHFHPDDIDAIIHFMEVFHG